MERTIQIGDREVRFKATGATMRIYRQAFQRDILKDMEELSKAHLSGESMTAEALIMFENIAYVMAKQADPDIPDNPDDWLDQFDMFSVYEVLPQIIELWGINNLSISESKKKAKRPTAR